MNTFHSSGQTSKSLDWEIDELTALKRHAVTFLIDHFIKVIGGGGRVSVIPNVVRFLQKNGKTVLALSPIMRGGGRSRGPSGLTLLGVVTIEVHVQLGCLGVSIDALDRISCRVGYIIATIIVALVLCAGYF